SSRPLRLCATTSSARSTTAARACPPRPTARDADDPARRLPLAARLLRGDAQRAHLIAQLRQERDHHAALLGSGLRVMRIVMVAESRVAQGLQPREDEIANGGRVVDAAEPPDVEMANRPLAAMRIPVGLPTAGGLHADVRNPKQP